MRRMSRPSPAVARASNSRSSCRARSTAVRRCGWRSLPSNRRSSTSACSTRPNVPMPTASRWPAANWNARCAAKPRPSPKYLSPPHTTDFAILFLPTEGLYAEVMRRPGLADELQRVHRISIAGPSTLSALLNSLQMGFRTLALEKRSSEVWQVLGAVKTEFSKFGDVLAATKLTLERAAKNIESAETRSRQMARKLKSVEALPSEAAQLLLGAESDGDSDAA